MLHLILDRRLPVVLAPVGHEGRPGRLVDQVHGGR